MAKRYLLSALALLAPTGALAAPADAPARLQNNAGCVYEALGPDQREIAQVMLVELITKGGNPFEEVKKPGELKALTTDAIDACIKLYPWSAGKADASTGFAVFMMTIEAMTPVLEADGLKLADIDEFFRTNLPTWRLEGPPTPAMVNGLVAHLKAKGWDMEDQMLIGNAKFYFSLLVGRAAMVRYFSQFATYRR